MSAAISARHTTSATCPSRANLETIETSWNLATGFESPRINTRVDPEPIECRFLRGVARHRAPDPRGQLQAVERSVLREVEPVFHRGRWAGGRHRRPTARAAATSRRLAPLPTEHHGEAR